MECKSLHYLGIFRITQFLNQLSNFFVTETFDAVDGTDCVDSGVEIHISINLFFLIELLHVLIL